MPEMPTPGSRASRSGRAIKPPSTYIPTPDGKGRKRGPRKEISVVCGMCGRGNSPHNNPIVFCDGCNATWHQRCHTPVIPDAVLTVEETEWLCHKCQPARTRSISRPPGVQKLVKPARSNSAKKPKKSAKNVHPRLEPKAQVESLVAGNEFTPDQRRAYLAALSHAELVELAMGATINYPTVRLFPTDMLERPVTNFLTYTKPFGSLELKPAQQDASPTSLLTQKSTYTRAEQNLEHHLEQVPIGQEDTNDTTSPSRLKRKRTQSAPANPGSSTTLEMGNTSMQNIGMQPHKRPRTDSAPSQPSKKPSTPVRRSDHVHSPQVNSPLAVSEQQSRAISSYQESPSEGSEPDTEDDDVDTFDDHRLYPVPGAGFLTSLDAAEFDIIQEADDYSTFSHRLHGPAKIRRPRIHPQRQV